MKQVNIFYNKYKGHKLEEYDKDGGKYYYNVLMEIWQAIEQDRKQEDNPNV